MSSEAQKRYANSSKGKLARKKYQLSEKAKETHRKYILKRKARLVELKQKVEPSSIQEVKEVGEIKREIASKK